MMTVLDFFCGACGGWSLGLERAGFVTIAACEIDEWRRRQFAHNFPNARIYDDVKTLTANRLRTDGIWPIDVICGSPPCQDASVANAKGRGIDGKRTGLYLEAVRLVCEIRPSWFAFENVPGIRNRGIDRVLGLLEEGGYACWPLVVGAADLGAPHLRKRSIIIGANPETVQRLALPWDQSDRNSECIVGNPNCNGLEIECREHKNDEPKRSSIERAITTRCGRRAETWNGGITGRIRVDDGVPKGMARSLLAAYGDAFIPQIPEIIGRTIFALSKTNNG